MKRTSALLASALTAMAITPLSPLPMAWATPSPPPDMTTPPASPTETGTPTETGSPTESPTESPTGEAAAPFGPGCADLPQSGEGSIESMSQVPLGDAISQNPQLSMLSRAISTANLEEQLNSRQDLTVFAPTDEAFSSVPREDLTRLLGDPSQLGKVLTNHVVRGEVTKDDLADGQLETMGGETLTVEGSGEDFTVNGEAKILCGAIPTQNGMLYMIDKVLLPQ